MGMRSSLRLGLAVLLLAAVGCGASGPKIVPVSGRVMMDNKPLAKARVTFQPIGKGGNLYPGPGSYGETDADGNYSLKTVGDDKPGAVVGEHRVEISLPGARPADNDDRTPMRNGVPPRYNVKSELRFTVPDGGTSEANFPDLKRQ